jgi:formate dehydrogenase subunit gamma
VFYLIRGKLDYERKPGDRVIQRFKPIDRYAHWLLGITWVTLAITGLILSLGKTILLPLIGYTLFSWLAILAKDIHNFIGPVLIVAVPLMFVRYIRDNGIGIEDLKWLVNIWGYFTGHEYPSGKYNAGEKSVFWIVLVVLTPVLVVTGLVLVFPNFDQTRATMQTANVIHMLAAYGAMALACVHVYLGTIGMTDAYRAMRDGYVDASWAKHHHARWYEDIVAGRAREKFVQPEEAVPGESDDASALRRRPA